MKWGPLDEGCLLLAIFSVAGVVIASGVYAKVGRGVRRFGWAAISYL